MNTFQLVLLTVFLTLAFEFSNGWHDAANSIATVVSTRVLTPFRAVLWAAFWNFVAAFLFGTAVAQTIGKGMVHLEMVNEQVLLAGLLGAIIWNLITLTLGLPTSSSHALMGGYGGAAVAHAGLSRRLSRRLDEAGSVYFSFADDRNAVRHYAHDRTTWIVRNQRPQNVDRWFRGCSCCRRRCTAWVTARTTRKRGWGSSRRRWWPADC